MPKRKQQPIFVQADCLDMLASNITKGAYAPYVGRPDLYCGLPCDPCDTTVPVSERLLDSMYTEALDIFEKKFKDSVPSEMKETWTKANEHVKKYSSKKP